jgi:hypothetical protein
MSTFEDDIIFESLVSELESAQECDDEPNLSLRK